MEKIKYQEVKKIPLVDCAECHLMKTRFNCIQIELNTEKLIKFQNSNF